MKLLINTFILLVFLIYTAQMSRIIGITIDLLKKAHSSSVVLELWHGLLIYICTLLTFFFTSPSTVKDRKTKSY